MASKWLRGRSASTANDSLRKSKWARWLGSRRKPAPKPLTVEMLEERSLLSTTTWMNPGSGNWDVGANWSTGQVPGNTDDVIINTASAATITIQSGDNESVRSLTTAATDTLSFTGGALTVAASSPLSGPLKMTAGSITANGAGVTLTVSSTTTLSGANLVAEGGATISLPNLTTYTAVNNNSIFEATGAASTLDLPGLVSLGNMSQFWQVEGFAGGTVNLPGLATVNQPNANVQFNADGAGSLITLSSSLTKFTGGGGSSELKVTNGGAVTAAGLTSFSDVNVMLDGTGTVSTSQWTTFAANSTLTATGGTYSLDSLTSFDNSNFLMQNGGSVTASNLTSFKATANNTLFEATGVGSALNLPGLVSLGNMSQFWQVEGFAGGTVNLAGLATVNQPNANIQLNADGTGSQIVLSSSLTSFTGGGGSSELKVTNGATVTATGLTSFNNVDVILDGTGTVSTSQWTTFAANSTLTVTGGAYSFAGLTSFDSSDFLVQNGGSVTVSNLTSFKATANNTIFEATGVGSTLNLPGLVSLGSMSQFWQVQGFAGGTVNLPGLATVNQPNANIQFNADGTGSQIVLSPLLTRFAGGGGSSEFKVTNDATITATGLTSFSNVDVILDGTGTVSTSQWAAFAANSTLTVTGGTYSLASLTSFDNSSFLVQSGGSVTAPNLTSFNATANNTIFEATGVGSTLNLPGLVALGNMTQFWQVEAFAGGTVELPGLGTVNQPNANIQFNADGTGSQLVLSSSLTSFTGGGGSSELKVTNGGAITAPALASFTNINIILDGTGTVSTSQWASIAGGSLTVSGGSYALPAVTNLDNSNLTVKTGGSLALPNLTSLTNTSISDTGNSTLAAPELTTLNKDNVTTDGTDNNLGSAWTTFTNGTLNVTGGTLTLPVLNDIANSGISLSGGAALNLPVLEQGNITLAAGTSVTIQGVVVSLPASGTSGSTVTLPQSSGLTITLDNNGTLTGTTFDVGQGSSLVLSGGTYNGGTTFNVAQNGSVQLAGGTYTGGVAFALGVGATADLTGGQTTNFGGTLTGSGSGTVNFSGGNFDPQTGGVTLSFPSSMFQWTGGNMFAALGDLTNLGTINLGGSQDKGFFEDATLDNFGTIIQTGTGNLGLHSDNISPTILKNEVGASYLIESDSGIDNEDGGATALVNAGIIRKTAGSGTSTLFINGAMSNTGTLEVDSGTMVLNATSLAQVSNGSLTGGAWTSLNGATLQLPAGTAVTTNAAQITLSGSNAAMTGIAGLSSNSGSFTLTNGVTFQTTGAFTNSGSLTVGPGGTLKVAGAETEAAGSTLIVQIGGTPASGLFGQVAVTGTATLGGTFDATLLNGFAPSAGQDFKAMTYGSAGGTFSSVNVGTSFTLAINATSLDLNSTVTNPVDLSLSNIGSPNAATTGQQITVTWTVTNQSTQAAVGSWQDSVYLSTSPTITASSVLIGAAAHGNGLAANGSYNGSLHTAVPAVPPGSYFVIVQVDSLHQVQDTNRSNNTLASTGQIVLSVPPLTLGTPFTGSFTASNQDQYYQVTVPVGGSLVVSLASKAATGGVALYVSQGSLPTPFSYQEASAATNQTSQTVIVPQVFTAGTFYVLAHSVSGAAATAGYTLTVTQGSALTVIAASAPYVGGNAGNATIEIDGTNFTTATTASLTLGSATINAASIDFVSGSQLFATFNLAGASVGTYALKVTQGAQSATAPTSFQVVAATSTGLNVALAVPQIVRSGRTGTIVITYSNTTSNDMVAPLLDIASTNANIFFSTPDDPNNFTQDALVLAVAPSGPAGILRPGQTGTLTLTLLSEDTIDNDAIPVEVDQLQSGQPNDLASQQAALQPSTISTAAWNIVFGNLLATVGTTSDSFDAALAQAATYLSSLGESSATISNVNNLWSFLVSQANATYPTATLTAAVDASLTTPGLLSLAIDRSFVSSIADRNQQGIFGLGWSTSWDTSISVDSSGNASISSEGYLSYFVLQPNGSYIGTDGTNGALTSSGGVFTLTSSTGTKYVFLPNGFLNFEQDTNGNRITPGYDASSRLTTLTYSNPADPSEPAEQLTLTYNAAGLVAQESDGTSNSWTFTYDSSSHLISVVGPGNLTTSYTYDTGSNPETANALLSVTNSDGSQQNFTYDSLGRLSGISANGGANPVAYAYLGQAEVMATDAAGNQTIVWYNELGLPSRIEDPRGGISSYLYDANGNPINSTDAAGNSYQYSYDGDGDLTQIINPLGQSVLMSYGALDNLTSITDASGNQTQYGYDSTGNLLNIAYPGGSQQSFTYDPLGNLSETIEQNGDPLAYQYNTQGLISTEAFADGSSQAFTYDAHGNLLTASTFDPADTLTGTTTMTYNAANELLSITYPGGQSLTFTYNPTTGQRTQSVDQSGYTLTYSYDSLGRLSQLSDGSGMVVQYTYNSVGELQKKVNGNGTFTTYAYDASGNLISEVNFAGGTTVNSSFGYTYNLLDEMTSMTDAANNVTSYAYDALGQLTQVSLPGGMNITYVYNAAGNRTEAITNGTPTNYSSNSQNEITQVGAATYTYDANGNLHTVTDAAGTTTYTYNDLNELVSIVDPDNTTTTFQYSPLGYLIGTNIDGTQTDDLVDPTGLSNVVSSYSGAGALIAHYNFGPGLASQTGPSGTGYYDFDGSGNTAGITGSGGTYVNRYSYLPFGETSVTSAALPNPFTFAGQVGVMQFGANLFSMRARNYSPATGQFLSNDPIGLAAGDTNIRRYVSNNPNQFVDPSGLTEGNGVFFGPAGFYVNIPITRGQAFDNAIAPGLAPGFTSGIPGIAGKVIDQQVPNPYQGVQFGGRDETFYLIHFNFLYPTPSSLFPPPGGKNNGPVGGNRGHGGAAGRADVMAEARAAAEVAASRGREERMVPPKAKAAAQTRNPMILTHSSAPPASPPKGSSNRRAICPIPSNSKMTAALLPSR